ncbi:MAG: tRNA (adenosine(37)-N6)-threonylcarbamoyltransferase complex dimerization subunit type 1 TsaB [Gallionellaceae bacterium]|nr:tRNA (adenosine(37)-N6)-threonylcarbamoyltransferase complex dimerization subunit type 1 TsaB [Gallionellaceae bacterium]
MNILALETSTEYCSVALWCDGVTHAFFEPVGQRHSMLLMPMLDTLLLTTNHTLQDIDGIAFGAGPGSFTGVRIACGAAQGLALGANLPVAGICTLQALAQAARHDKVIAALDARMGEVYFAAYEKSDGAWRVVCEPGLYAPRDVPPVSGDGWVCAGSGFLTHGAELRAAYAGQFADVDEHAVPHASAVAELAAPLFAAGLGQDAADAQPIYLRDKVALKTSER